MRIKSAVPFLFIFLFLAIFTRNSSTAGLTKMLAVPSALNVKTSNNGYSIMLIENAGQWPEAARYQVWGSPAETLWLEENAIWITVAGWEEASPEEMQSFDASERERVRPAVADQSPPIHGANIKIAFLGSNPHPQIEPFSHLDTTVSFLMGSDPASWRTEVPVWDGVRYRDLYPGVDLVVGNSSAGDNMFHPFWALRARDDAATEVVKLSIEGADSVFIENGRLRLVSGVQGITLPLFTADFSYSIGESIVLSGQPGEAALAQAESQDMAPADNPSDLLYSTFLGGSGSEEGDAIAIDSSGRAYVTGYTLSNNFPITPGAFDTSRSSRDAYVARMNANGSGLEYATFLGGSSADYIYGIAVDASFRAYVTGTTASNNFPVTAGAYDTGYNGTGPYSTYGDAFILRLNTTGSALEYSTYLGGSDEDVARGITVDPAGRAYVTGWTNSYDFPDTASFGGDWEDAFVTRLNAAGSALGYSIRLGGFQSDDDYFSAGEDYGYGIAVDASGRAYVTGITNSSNFPATSGAFDRWYDGDRYAHYDDAFVARLNANGTALEYATYLGDYGGDSGNAIAVDSTGRAYVTGSHWPYEEEYSYFPVTSGAFDISYNGFTDAFVVHLNANGSALEYGTFLGGTNFDAGYAIAVDASGRAIVTGSTLSRNFPTTIRAFDTTSNGSGYYDVFVARLSATGGALEYGTFLGGSADDRGYAIAVDASGRAYVTGELKSSNFPVTAGAFDATFNGNSDGFVAKLAMGGTTIPTATPTRPPTATPTPPSGSSKTKSFQNGVAPSASYAGNIDAHLSEAQTTTNFGATTSIIVSGSDPAGTGKDKWALLKWDLSSIAGWVQSATITFNVTDPSPSQTYELYETTVAWNEAATTWANKPTKGSTVLGVAAPANTGALVIPLYPDGIAVVQKWLTTPTSNNGFYLLDTTNTDGLVFDSSEQNTATLRPKLTITYKPPALSRTPWVENITTTGANVLWETDIYSKGTLNYRQQGAATWANKTVTTILVGGKWQAKTVLTGLMPNSAYEYRVRASTDSAWIGIATFWTAATAADLDSDTEPAIESDSATGGVFLPLLRR